jgi:methylphosphotriester-DNA--protein-cysteine methyltransferase
MSLKETVEDKSARDLPFVPARALRDSLHEAEDILARDRPSAEDLRAMAEQLERSEINFRRVFSRLSGATFTAAQHEAIADLLNRAVMASGRLRAHPHMPR